MYVENEVIQIDREIFSDPLNHKRENQSTKIWEKERVLNNLENNVVIRECRREIWIMILLMLLNSLSISKHSSSVITVPY